jgi:hypothetical protein
MVDRIPSYKSHGQVSRSLDSDGWMDECLIMKSITIAMQIAVL